MLTLGSEGKQKHRQTYETELTTHRQACMSKQSVKKQRQSDIIFRTVHSLVCYRLFRSIYDHHLFKNQ